MNNWKCIKSTSKRP